MITVGILSDTHMDSANDSFLRQCTTAFAGCDVIIHAGDITGLSILAAFKGKETHAVCGNMCNSATRKALPVKKQIVLSGYTIGIIHGAGPRHNIEERVFDTFPAVDCIIFGHTHIPVCRKIGHTLLINPGSFQGTGRYGSAGTYGLLHIENNGLKASIHSLPDQL